jgi:hypothetical protein
LIFECALPLRSRFLAYEFSEITSDGYKSFTSFKPKDWEALAFVQMGALWIICFNISFLAHMTYYYSSNDNRPRIISDGGGDVAYLSVNENTRYVTDVQTFDRISTEQNGRLSYFIVGGADKNLFEIDRYTGKVYFKEAPDYERPRDYKYNNRYQVEVKVVDAAGYSDRQFLNIQVKNVNENVSNRPTIISNGGGDSAHISVAENQAFVTDVQTFDTISSEANGRLQYSIVDGADKAAFVIDSKTGVLSFLQAPDYEKPTDVGADNTYEVAVKVTDKAGYSDTQFLKVKVGDVDDGGHDPGTGGQEIRGDNGDNTLTGTAGRDFIFGEGGNDFVDGIGGDDDIFGGAGNDVLIGGEGGDFLNGTDTASRGVGEVDNISGNAGADIFALGDAQGAFYLGNGFGDFAIIRDFNAAEDKVLLSGSASDYTTANGSDGNGFILRNGDAIAQFLGQDAANLNLSQFQYV